MRFLCDEMLARLARLLRSAGYDTALADRLSDTQVLTQARAENRVLLTRDRELAARAHPRSVLIANGPLDDEARSLARAVPVNWRLAPFTRCVVDNAPLRDATPAEIARAPAEAERGAGDVRACPECGRIYWPGSHVKRMSERLARLGASGA